jgi:4'-phosphopantetheinyl transferase
MRPDVAVSEIAERFFSGPEVGDFNALPAESRVEGFFNCWSRKEAYIKARGEGLSFPLDGFAVSLRPGEPAALLDVFNEPGEKERWILRDLPAGAGYAAALAVEGGGWSLECWDARL